MSILLLVNIIDDFFFFYRWEYEDSSVALSSAKYSLSAITLNQNDGTFYVSVYESNGRVGKLSVLDKNTWNHVIISKSNL